MYDDDGAGNAGAVYIHLLNSDGTVKSTYKISETSADGLVLGASDYFGSSVAGVGDYNEDGVVDVAVGAMYDDHPSRSNAGAIYILYLASDGTVDSFDKIDYGSANIGNWGNYYM